MKIRTDFVTNSSSSSYVYVNLKLKNDEKFRIVAHEAVWQERDIEHLFPREDGLVLKAFDQQKTIQSINDLIAAIEFSLTWDRPDSNIELFFPAFLFSIGKISFSELEEQLSSSGLLNGFDPTPYHSKNELQKAVEQVLRDKGILSSDSERRKKDYELLLSKVNTLEEIQSLSAVTSFFDEESGSVTGKDTRTYKDLMGKAKKRNLQDDSLFDSSEDFEIKGNTFVFINSARWNKIEHAERIALLGGRRTSSVSSKTNYLVVGNSGEYGKKAIATAMELKGKGIDIKLITEELFDRVMFRSLPFDQENIQISGQSFFLSYWNEGKKDVEKQIQEHGGRCMGSFGPRSNYFVVDTQLEYRAKDYEKFLKVRSDGVSVKIISEEALLSALKQ